MRSFVPCRSFRAVAITGRSHVFSRYRVSSKPIPREAGVVRIHGKDIVRWVQEGRRIDHRGGDEVECVASERDVP